MLWCFLTSFSYGQGGYTIVSGSIKEGQSGDGIPYANVYIADSTGNVLVGTITDLQGNFTLKISSDFYPYYINITFVGYQTFKARVSEYLHKSLSVFLKESITKLPAVTARAITAEELFLKCASHVNANYFEVEFLSYGFYWKSTKENGVFNDLVQKNVLVQENNFNKKISFQIYDSTYTQYLTSTSNYFNNLIDVLLFDLIRSSSGIMNLQNTKEWQFTYKDDVDLPPHYTRISAIRNDNLCKVDLLIDDRRYSIDELTFMYTWNVRNQHPLNDSMTYNLNTLTGKAIYGVNVTKYNLKYLFVTVNYDVRYKNNFNKRLNREIVHELVLNTSSETISNKLVDKRIGKTFEWFPTVVNTKAFCDAINVLGMKSDLCK